MDNRMWWLSLLGLGIVAIVWAGIAHLNANAEEDGTRTTPAPGAAITGETGAAPGAWRNFVKPTDAELAARLDPLSFRVTQEEGTESPFRNRYWNQHEDGIYVDIVSGEPLFSSVHKFDSGTGWPSFTTPLVRELVVEHRDTALGMVRTEVRSKMADSHLGHVFDDGPDPTGLRYCINSAALRFVPVDQLEEQGYGEFLAHFGKEVSMGTSDGKSVGEAAGSVSASTGAGAAPSGVVTEAVVLAGGCFWGMEDILREIPGVIETEVGYSGGHVRNATYQDVKKGTSGHAEAVRIVFDPARLSFEELLGYFFRMHDPTTKNRQGNDVGSQYRSAIFYFSEAQRETAERVKRAVDASGKWSRPIVTEVTPAGEFYSAEEYHQDYLEKNPNGYTCHYFRD